jgi:1-acyl-sn-glycerol-3-phosphate acyltransferase
MKHRLTQRFVRLIARIFIHSVYWVRYKGEKRLPEEGPYIVCSNHRSFLDIPIVGCIGKKRWMYFMGKKELFEKPFSGFFMDLMDVFPIDRGKGDLKSIKTALRHLKNDRIVVVFPQGTREKPGQKLPARKGAAMLVAMSEARIIPVCIEGVMKPFHRIRAYIGKPFDLGLKKGERYTRETYEKKSAEIMERIYSLPEVYGG